MFLAENLENTEKHKEMKTTHNPTAQRQPEILCFLPVFF